MAEFKVGDVVERISHPFEEMKVGNVGVVTEVGAFTYQHNFIKLRGHKWQFDPTAFKIVSPTAILDKWLKENPE